MIVPEEKIAESYSVITLDLTILNRLLVDLYMLLQKDPTLIRSLLDIRFTIPIINNRVGDDPISMVKLVRCPIYDK